SLGSRWLNQTGNSSILNAIDAFATALDSVIPPEVAGEPQARLIENLTNAWWKNRLATSTNPNTYIRHAESLAAIYQQIKIVIVPEELTGCVLPDNTTYATQNVPTTELTIVRNIKGVLSEIISPVQVMFSKYDPTVSDIGNFYRWSNGTLRSFTSTDGNLFLRAQGQWIDQWLQLALRFDGLGSFRATVLEQGKDVFLEDVSGTVLNTETILGWGTEGGSFNGEIRVAGSYIFPRLLTDEELKLQRDTRFPIIEPFAWFRENNPTLSSWAKDLSGLNNNRLVTGVNLFYIDDSPPFPND
ncbi:MAG: hypothetical protein R3321_04670, partial [Nitrososphaeraceae archaeon]|nr:hypothetical protein [Nitrososphaeraceae archaeon]